MLRFSGLADVRERASSIVENSEYKKELCDQKLRDQDPLSQAQKRKLDSLLIEVLESFEKDKIRGM
jgi:hypothetical protein